MNGRGFTLIEFLVTMVVASILVFVAVPGFYRMMQNNRVVTAANDMAAGFLLAKAEAIKRGQAVAICSASNASLSACGGAADWSNGWIVFADTNSNGSIDAASDIIKVHEQFDNTTLNGSSAVVSYSSSGFISSGNFTMTLRATGCSGNNARMIDISASGRLAVTRTGC